MTRMFLAWIFVLATPLLVRAQSATTEPVAIVREYVAAQNRADIDRMMTLVAEQVDLHTGLGSTQTRTESKSALRTRFEQVLKNFPGARSEIVEFIAQGNMVIAKERMTGLPGDVIDHGISMYRVRNGRIDAMWAFSTESATGDR